MAAWRWIAGGLGTALVGGAAAFYAKERAAEKPGYATLREDGSFTLRAYEPILVAEVTLTGGRYNTQSRGFQRLADYIFAKNRPGEKIAMTAPVLQDRPQERDGDLGPWRVRFVMPREYSKATLPPAPSDIAFGEVPGRRIAAVRFSGSGDDDKLDEKEADLRRWMAAQGLESTGAAEYAFYNSPFVPPFLRRNEVLIEVAQS